MYIGLHFFYRAQFLYQVLNTATAINATFIRVFFALLFTDLTPVIKFLQKIILYEIL